MKTKARHFFRRLQYPLITALAFFPMVLLVHSFFAPGLVGRSWQIPACYGVLAVVTILLPRKLRLQFSLLAGAVMVYLCCREHTGSLRWILAGEGAFYAVLLLWSLPFGSWDENQELSVGFLCFGLGMYAFLLIAEVFTRSQENLLLEQAVPWLTYGLVAYLLLALLSMNRRGLIQASAGRQKVPVAMRRKNLLMICLVCAAAGTSALLPQVVAWITGLGKSLVRLILGLLIHEGGEGETLPAGTVEGGGQPALDQFDDAGSSGVFVGELFRVLGAVLLVTLGSVLLFALLRKLFGAIGKMLKALGDRMNEGGEDYEDEITDTREDGIGDQSGKTRRGRGRRLWNELGLPPGEKIRYRFRVLLRRHPEWTDGTTAREKLPEEVAGLYEKVRYGDRPVTEAEAKTFRSETKNL